MWTKIMDKLFGQYETKPIPPFGQRTKTKPRTNGLSEDKEPLSVIGGQSFVQDKEDSLVQAGEAAIAYKAVGYHQLASRYLGPEEAEGILDAGLDVEKAALVKEQMAAGKTQRQASEKLTELHGKGFSRRTVAEYWRFLNPSPSTAGGGDPERGMQNDAKTA